ncbi:MAG: hypothetical protein SGPRY_009744 [Prymnesium sp.]
MSCGSLDEEECLALCDEEGCSIVAPTSFMRTLKLGMYFVLWFALSTGYNIENKASIRSSSSLSDCLRGARAARSPDGWLLLSLLTGSLFVIPLWLTGSLELRGAACPLFSELTCVSLAQIVKASEPVFTCGLSALLLGQTVSPLTAISLIPIVAGVALASVGSAASHVCWISSI